jgi:UDP-N-acetylmuramate: L-alanyl-gamma-D-glutamyl-meso-diaminopimelate ligase
VAATTRAVREQYPGRRLIACLELHTYSSLNAGFLEGYRGSLDAADAALVFYIPESLKIKGLQPLEPEAIREAFGRPGLEVFTQTAALQEYLQQYPPENSVLLLMSSGNYGGLDLDALVARLPGQA